jgi:hypothetical protein
MLRFMQEENSMYVQRVAKDLTKIVTWRYTWESTRVKCHFLAIYVAKNLAMVAIVKNIWNNISLKKITPDCFWNNRPLGHFWFWF